MKTHFDQLAPTTVQDAAAMLVSWMDDEDRKALTDPLARGYLHHGFMMHVRNEWKLWDTSTPVVRNTKEVYGVDHADDVSGLIQGGLLAILDGVEFDYEAEARRYRDHWAKMGVAH